MSRVSIDLQKLNTRDKVSKITAWSSSSKPQLYNITVNRYLTASQ